MKELTHYVFSIGVSFYLISRLGQASLFYLVFAVWLALAVNNVIDVLGHGIRTNVTVRSFLTHSVFTAPLWGAAVAAVSIYAFNVITGEALTLGSALLTIGLGVVIAYSHLFLDALTEGGVYYGRHRIALAHFRYDNRILNATFVVFGILLILPAVLF